ncbi:MAG TPA: hypothetical protein VN663_01015 [Ramlibacter sp.]|nr:hypothetical protein [Ramlibacter sp.]
MKQYLAPIAILAAAACHAQSQSASQSSSDIRQVSAQKSLPAPAVAPRQLSDQERAELRRQLYQYSRVAGKGS